MNVFILGLGQVGSELSQLLDGDSTSRPHPLIRVLAVADSSGLIELNNPLSIQRCLAHKAMGKPLSTLATTRDLEWCRRQASRSPLAIADCTAGSSTSRILASFASAGANLVLANKEPLADLD